MPYFRDSVTGQLLYIDDSRSAYLDYYQRQNNGGAQDMGPMDYVSKGKDAYDLYNKFYGSGGGGSNISGPGGYGGPMGYAAIVAAAIAAQHAMSKGTDRRFEGQATKDAFGGSYATEPWLAFGYDKLGIDSPSAGESFDAAWQNGDYNQMLRRGPRAAGYWLEPGSSVGFDVIQDKVSKPVANMIFPQQWAFNQIGSLLGKIF